MFDDEECSQEGSMLFYSSYSYDASWSVRCALPEHAEDCTPTEVSPDSLWNTYVLTYNAVTLTHVRKSGCESGDWKKIGTATSLEEAKKLMFDDEECSQEGSMLFYSSYSYDASWSVRCALPEHAEDCTPTEVSPDSLWNTYVLTYNGGFGIRENGYCVLADGADQNDGVEKAPGSYASAEECLAWCASQKPLTGCEYIWDQSNAGCYAHRAEVSHGNGVDNHYCWIYFCGGDDNGCGGNLAEGDGDCDSDSDCQGSLVCGTNNCGDFRDNFGWGHDEDHTWDLADDCCMQPATETSVGLVAYAMQLQSAPFHFAIYSLALVGMFAIVVKAFTILRPKMDYAEVEENEI